MSKAAGILGIIGGVFGLIAAVVTLLIGGLGTAFDANNATEILGYGWGGIVFSIASIVFGATAFSKPKGSGILLILTSVAGAILGGTFVAVCLVLSLIGGALALFAVSQPQAKAVTAEDDQSAPSLKKQLLGWKLAVGVCGLLGLIFGITSLATNNKASGAKSGSQPTVASRQSPLEELAAIEPSDIAPDGELAELFSFGSRYTDIQRENALRELKGEVIAWRLPIYDVQRRGDKYRIQFSTTRNSVGAFATVSTRNDEERRFVEALTTGEMVAFKGVIKGTTVRSFDIDPAILDRPVVRPQAAVTTSAPARAQQPQNAPIALTDELETIAGLLEAVDDKLLIGSTIITREMGAMNLAIAGGWPSNAAAKYALVLLNSGGSACPATFKIVDLTGSGSLTSEFGNCSDIPVASFDGKKLRVEFAPYGSAPPERYEYEAGKLAKLN